MHALALAFFIANSPTVTASLVEARTHIDSHWYGEKAFLFRMQGLTAHGLDGKTIIWTLDVKRKLADWSTAKSWLVAKQPVTSAGLYDIAYALTYRNMAKAKFVPGEHVAKFTGKVDGVDVFTTEIRFVLPALGPNAYDPRQFKKK
jgi:hypothetical protein